MRRAFGETVLLTLIYGMPIAAVVIGSDLLAMVLIESWEGINTWLLLVGCLTVAAAIAAVQVSRDTTTDS